MATFEYFDPDFVDTTLSSSADMNANFEDVRDFLTQEVVHTDGTIPMTAPLVVHSQSGASSATSRDYYEQQCRYQSTISGSNPGWVYPADGYPRQTLVSLTVTPPVQAGVFDVNVVASGYLNSAYYAFIGGWCELMVTMNGVDVTGIRDHAYAVGDWINLSGRFIIPYTQGPNTFLMTVQGFANSAQFAFANDGWNRITVTSHVTEQT